MKTSMMLKDRYPEAVKSSGAARLHTAISTSTWQEAGRARGRPAPASMVRAPHGLGWQGVSAESPCSVCPSSQNALGAVFSIDAQFTLFIKQHLMVYGLLPMPSNLLP